MTITLEIEGGFAFFPGLARPLLVDTDALSPEEAARLNTLVESANFFNLPASMVPERPAADTRQYTITVRQKNKTHTIQAAEPITSRPLQALLRYLKEKESQQKP